MYSTYGTDRLDKHEAGHLTHEKAMLDTAKALYQTCEEGHSSVSHVEYSEEALYSICEQAGVDPYEAGH